MLSYIISDSGRISVVCNNKPFSINPTHPRYKEIREAVIAQDSEAFLRFVEIVKVVEAGSAGEITITNGQVMYQGKVVHNSITERILKMLGDGSDFKPLTIFLGRLMRNPSRRAINELYSFLAHKGMPITPDGCFIGYKGVTSDYLDCHTRTIDNSVGAVIPPKARNEVDDNWGIACSEGYHVGTLDYAWRFGAKVMLVKVAPENVVTVPSNETDKLRCTVYEVVGELDKKDYMPDTVYDPNPPNPTNDADDDDEYSPYETVDDDDYYDSDCDDYCDNDCGDEEEVGCTPLTDSCNSVTRCGRQPNGRFATGNSIANGMKRDAKGRFISN
jgi:hypothetical protein